MSFLCFVHVDLCSVGSHTVVVSTGPGTGLMCSPKDEPLVGKCTDVDVVHENMFSYCHFVWHAHTGVSESTGTSEVRGRFRQREKTLKMHEVRACFFLGVLEHILLRCSVQLNVRKKFSADCRKTVGLLSEWQVGVPVCTK